MEFRGIKYSPQTGLFWRCYKGHGKIKPFQKILRSPDKDGYYRIGYKGKTYKQHRVAWMIMNNGADIPEGMVIDHINGNKQDNSWKNLRLLTIRENNQNRKKRTNYLCAYKKRDLYESYVTTEGKKSNFLGCYKTALEAHTAALNFMDEHNIPYLKELDNRVSSVSVPKYEPVKKPKVILNGQTVLLKDAAKIIGVSGSAFYQRRSRKGWDFQKTLDYYLKHGFGRIKNKPGAPKGYRKKLVKLDGISYGIREVCRILAIDPSNFRHKRKRYSLTNQETLEFFLNKK